MEITLERTGTFDHPTRGDGTLGQMSIDGERFCVTLEDEFRNLYEKVKGETRIPPGRYPVRKREVLSGLTKRYRANKKLKGIFDFHIQICDVPFFENVYIHIGNFSKNTDGCVLVGEKALPEEGMITNSTNVYIKFYQLVTAALDRGEEIWIEIS